MTFARQKILPNAAMRLTSCEEVELRMCSHDPESIMFPPECLHRGPLRHVPHPDRLILARRQNQLVPRVEHGHRDVVEMTSTTVNFPSFGFGHPPELDLSIITTGYDERECGVECGPINSSVMALENIFDDRIGVSEQIRLTLIGSSYLLLEGHRCLMRLVLLPQSRDVPDTNGKIH